MKKILFLMFLLTSLSSYGQIRFKFPDTRVLTDISGGVIDRGDQFDVIVQANGNSDATTRQLLFDFQYDMTNLEIVSINHTGTGGNGGVLPAGSNIQSSWQNYPGYGYAGNTTNTNGTTRYTTGLGYSYNAASSNAIIRVTLTWATSSPMPFTTFDRLLVVRFRLKASSTANSFNPVRLNFVAGWNGQGNGVATLMDNPLSTEVVMNQNTGKLVTAKVDINSNLLSLSDVKVSFKDTLTNVGQLFNVLSNGNVDINQSLLSENKVYEVTVMHNMDRTNTIYNGAITISDFTTAQTEFTTMGLDGSNGQILKTGQSLYAADINRNKSIDGGDLPRLLGQVVGIDTLITVPAGYVMGSNGYMSLPTWRSTDATTNAGQVEWGIIEVNSYGQNITKVSVDLREFTGTNILPENIKSLQLFDLYSGPVEFVSKDGTWAYYKVPSGIPTILSSTFAPYIRNMGNNSYGIKSEFSFNTSPSYSWGSVTTTNWKDITYPKTYVKTGVMGTNEIVDLKYLLWGDVNRSHSSQVVTTDNGTSTVQTNAVNSLSTNTAFISMSSKFINTPNNISSINVNLSNVTVTSNNVVIPISINTNGNSVGGLQFEFDYDPTKIKFEELSPSVPNTWYVFANSVTGKVKFGALDQNNKTPINGAFIPFKLKFSTIGNGVDILTSVKVSPTMDASSSNGTQLGIDLNTTQIKLTGYNNF
jgi:hypothetical protein